MIGAGSRAPHTFIANLRYEVIRYIGGGTYGEVYEVFDHHQLQPAALKLLNGSNPTPWEEAQRLTALRSQYILPVLNADTEAGIPFIVTELAQYGSADGPMRPIGVPPALAVRWVEHACRGAARTHQAGIVHRDIKPANVFLTAEGEAVLGDFGIAHPLGVNGLAPALGTPVTVAPEAMQGGPGPGASVVSDVYSLGATLYGLLAGSYAHDGPNVQWLVLNEPPPPLRDRSPHVSQALDQRVMRAMATDPADRYQSATDFAAALGNLPRPSRSWRRSDEHVASKGHYACWIGESDHRADATVCAVQAGTRYEVIAEHVGSGRRINVACRPASPLSALSRNLRVAMSKLR
jgi:serine/threonine protein kinase